MTPRQPLNIATWMLKHFGSGPNNDVVLGDLLALLLRRSYRNERHGFDTGDSDRRRIAS